MSADKGESASIFSQASEYLSGSVEELKKVSTPTRQETLQATLATVVIILFFAVCLMVLDAVCNWLMSLLT
ncbi:MAG: preprotein translocase subunit SecE [Deltaproteobacteria bacterium]|nr:preprotein translocase subunit SecE [Deltaproteobacteria bacterium]